PTPSRPRDGRVGCNRLGWVEAPAVGKAARSATQPPAALYSDWGGRARPTPSRRRPQGPFASAGAACYTTSPGFLATLHRARYAVPGPTGPRAPPWPSPPLAG